MKRGVTSRAENRRGVSLVELCIVMGFASVVLGTGIGTLHLLLRTDKTLTDSVWRSQTVAKVSRTFRGDVHAARNITTEQPANNAGPLVVVLELAEGHLVRYSIDGPQLFRKETQADKTLHNERFRFSPGTVISIQTDQPKTAALIIQSINPTTKELHQTPTNLPLRELKIEAVKGRDHRWTEAAQQSAEETP
jgi:hypothetical protein